MASSGRYVLAVLVLICLLSATADRVAAEPSARIQVPAGRQNHDAEVKSGSYELANGSRPGDTLHVEANLEVSGQVKLAGAGAGAAETLPMSVVAKVNYLEHLLECGPEAGAPSRSIRSYRAATARIQTGKQQVQPKLSEQRQQILVRCGAGRTTMFSPQGPLTREELDLIDILGNSLILSALLPGKRVSVGDEWLHGEEVISALLGMDAISQCEVRSVLGQVTGQVARVALAGTVQGAAAGVGTELDVQGSYDFDLRRRLVTRLQLKVAEKRSIGHIGPGLDVVAQLQMAITPAESSELAVDLAAMGAASEETGTSLLSKLVHDSQRGEFRLTYDRRWYVTGDYPTRLTLRLLDRGELIAQCHISPVSKKSTERQATLDEYQRDVQYALGERFGALTKASQWEDQHGQRIFCVVARGKVDELSIVWHYYLVAHPSGRRVAIAFTVEEALAARLDEVDRELVEGLEIVATEPREKLDAANRPEPQTRKATPK